MDDTNGDAKTRQHVDAVPERGADPRDERSATPRRGRPGGAGDPRLLHRQRTDGPPPRRDVALERDLEPLRALRARLHDQTGGRAGSHRVRAVEPIERRAHEQRLPGFPAQTEFDVLEALGGERHTRGVEEVELLPRLREGCGRPAPEERERRPGRPDEPQAWRREGVGPLEIRRLGAAIVEPEREAVPPHAGDGGEAVGQGELVLRDERGQPKVVRVVDGGRTAVVGEEGATAIEEARDGARRVDASVVAPLTSAFEGEEHRVSPATEGRGPDQIDLRERVGTVGGTLIGRDRHRAIGGGDGATREDVVIALRVVTDREHRAQRERIAPRVVERRAQCGDVDRAARRGGIPEVGRGGPAPRPAVERGDAAIDGPVVGEHLALHLDGGARPQRQPRGGRDPATSDRHRLTERAALLCHGVEAPREALPRRPAEVARQARLPEPVAREVERADPTAIGGLHHAIDRAAPGTTPEGERCRALDDVDPLDGVEVAEILEVVADPIDEEVRRADVAAEHGGIAVTLTLGHRHARHVADEVPEAGDGLVLDGVARDDGDRLRGLHQRGRGACQGPRGASAVAVLGADDPDGVDRLRQRGLGLLRGGEARG